MDRNIGRTASKRRRPDARDAVGYRHTRQTAASIKRTIPDARDAVGNNNITAYSKIIIQNSTDYDKTLNICQSTTTSKRL